MVYSGICLKSVICFRQAMIIDRQKRKEIFNPTVFKGPREMSTVTTKHSII